MMRNPQKRLHGDRTLGLKKWLHYLYAAAREEGVKSSYSTVLVYGMGDHFITFGTSLLIANWF